jgi:predicted dehydrogenase
MAAERLRIGMIGCGGSAAATAQGVDAADHAHLIAVSDADEVMARATSAAFGVPWVPDAAALLAREDVDAVYIAAPPHLRASLAIQAAQAGKHVLCEKPLAVTLADADRMIAACAQSGVYLSVDFEAQVTPSRRAARDLLAGGALGDVVGARIVALSDQPAPGTGHLGDKQGPAGGSAGEVREAGSAYGRWGGVLAAHCLDHINTVRYLTGLEVTRVYAEYGLGVSSLAVPPAEGAEYLVATLRYANGAIGHVEAGCSVSGAPPFLPDDDTGAGGSVVDTAIRIYGSAGQLVLSNPPRLWTSRASQGVPARTWQDLGAAAAVDARAAIVEAFAVAVLERRPPPVSGQDGRAALEVVLAAYRAGRDGRPIEVGTPMLDADYGALRAVALPEGSPPAFVFQPLMRGDADA